MYKSLAKKKKVITCLVTFQRFQRGLIYPTYQYFIESISKKVIPAVLACSQDRRSFRKFRPKISRCTNLTISLVANNAVW